MADGTIIIDVELNEQAFRNSLENMGEIVKTGADQMIGSVNYLSGGFALLPNTINSAFRIVPNLINGVINTIRGQNPVMTQAGNDFFMSFTANLPGTASIITERVPEITGAVIARVLEAAPEMSETGDDFFGSLVSNIPGINERIAEAVPEITAGIAETVASGAPLMSDAGYDLFCSLTQSIPKASKTIAQAPNEIISLLVSRFNSLTGQFHAVGENIVHGVWAGISSMASWLANSVKGFFSGIVGAVTGFLGISSPSKLFRDLVGKNIALGIKAGIDDEMPAVTDGARTHIARLAEAAAHSAVLTPASVDIIGITGRSAMFGEAGTAQNRLDHSNAAATQAAPEITVTLEPSGDMRGFFDYIRMGVKRAAYLSGER